MDQKSEETLFVKLSWNTRNFEPLSPEVLSALKKLEDSPECQKPKSRHSTSRSCQTPAHPVSPNAKKLLKLDGKFSCKVVFSVLWSFVIHQFFCCLYCCLYGWLFWDIVSLESQSGLFVWLSFLGFIHLGVIPVIILLVIWSFICNALSIATVYLFPVGDIWMFLVVHDCE